MTDNKGGGSTGYPSGAPSATTDKVFLLSRTEVYCDVHYGASQSDGTQYEYYKLRVSPEISHSWTRSVNPSRSTTFFLVLDSGDWSAFKASGTYYVCPAWCF